MVYPKKVALRKSDSSGSAVSSSSNASYKANKVEAKATSIQVSNNSHDSLAVVCRMMENYNKIIANNCASIKKLEIENARNASKWKTDFDDLLTRITGIEERLDSTEAQMKKTVHDSEGLAEDMGKFVDTIHVTAIRLGVIEQRVSRIEQLILRSRKRKRASGR